MRYRDAGDNYNLDQHTHLLFPFLKLSLLFAPDIFLFINYFLNVVLSIAQDHIIGNQIKQVRLNISILKIKRHLHCLVCINGNTH